MTSLRDTGRVTPELTLVLVLPVEFDGTSEIPALLLVLL